MDVRNSMGALGQTYSSDIGGHVEEETTSLLSCEQRFFCQWDTGKERPNVSVGVGYIGDTSSTTYDVYVEALHLSQALNGTLVFGVQRGQSREVEAVIECWEEFLHMYHYGLFIQYFYGNGADVVEEALRNSYCNDQIILVGINPSQVVRHPHVYYYSSWGSIRSRFLPRGLHVMTFPINPNSGTIWMSGIADPVFIAAIQYAYYRTLGRPPVEFLSSHIPVSMEVSQILQYPRTVRDVTTRRYAEDFDTGQWLTKISQDMLEQGERWPEVRIAHLANTVLCCSHISDYVYLLAKRIIACYQDVFPPIEKQWSSCSLPSNTTKISFLPHVLQASWFRKENSLLDARLREIYPCRILPNWSFPGGIDLLPQGDREIFPYNRFFEGQLFQDWYASAIFFQQAYHLEIKSLKQQWKNNWWQMFPYGINPQGTFLPVLFRNETRWDYTHPYSEVNQKIHSYYAMNFSFGAIDHEEVSLLAPLNYTLFFSGALIGLENPGVDTIYPCGILPNGSFSGAYLGSQQRDLYPYGVFPNNDFPYGSFFLDSFDYEHAYLNGSNVCGWYIRPSAIQTFLSGSKLVQVCDYKTTVWWATWGFIGLWILQGSSSAILVATMCSRRWKRLRVLAMSITSTMVICTVLDGVYNIQRLFNGQSQEAWVRGALLSYDSVFLLRETALLAVKPVRRAIQSAWRKYPVTLVNGMRRNLVKIDNAFRWDYRHVIASIYLIISACGLLAGFMQVFSFSPKGSPDLRVTRVSLYTEVISGIMRIASIIILCVHFIYLR